MSKFLLTTTNLNIAAQISSLLNIGGQLFYRQTAKSIIYSNRTYIVELYGEQVAGVIGLELKESNIIELKHLCVHPNHRCKGIGLKLLQKGIEYANTEFVCGLVRNDNFVNIRNNIRAGFMPVAKYRSRGKYIIVFTRRRINNDYGKTPTKRP